MTTVKMIAEIFEAMQFLGIPSEKFEVLKNQYGSTVKLHAALGEMLSGN
jgi:hypothetical protein